MEGLGDLLVLASVHPNPAETFVSPVVGNVVDDILNTAVGNLVTRDRGFSAELQDTDEIDTLQQIVLSDGDDAALSVLDFNMKIAVFLEVVRLDRDERLRHIDRAVFVVNAVSIGKGHEGR